MLICLYSVCQSNKISKLENGNKFLPMYIKMLTHFVIVVFNDMYLNIKLYRFDWMNNKTNLFDNLVCTT